MSGYLRVDHVMHFLMVQYWGSRYHSHVDCTASVPGGVGNSTPDESKMGCVRNAG